MATESAKYLSTLHKQIDDYFSFDEVRTLCFDLGVDYENIPGNIRSAFIRNLIISLAKQKRLQELVDAVRQERSFVDWQDVPDDFELPTSMAQENIQQVVNYHVYGNYVGGDQITVGNIENSQGVAIGRGSQATVQQNPPAATPTLATDPSTAVSTIPPPSIERAIQRVTRYLHMVSPEYQETAEELARSLTLVTTLAGQSSVDPLHLKLLCLGQSQLAQTLAVDVPGIEAVVEEFVVAVQQSV